MFGLHPLDLVVMAVYFVIVLIIAWRAMKRVHNQEDFFLAGRRFGRFFQTFSQFGQATSTESAVQTTSMVGVNGLAAAFSSILGGIVGGPLAWLFPKWLRRLRLMSMADYFVDRFRSRGLAALYAITQAAMFILVGGMALFALSKTVCAVAEKPEAALTVTELAELSQAQRLETLETTPLHLLGHDAVQELEHLRRLAPRRHFSHIDQNLLILVIAGFVILYALGGGLAAAVLTDAMQSMFILVLTLLLIPCAMYQLNAAAGTSGPLGAFSAIHRILPESMFEIFGSPRWVEFTWYNILILLLISAAGNIAFSNNLVVSGAARSDRIASYGGMTGSMIKYACMVFWMLLALFILGLFGGVVSDPDLLWGMAIRSLLPVGLVGLMMACLVAALMSTADTHMMTVSGLLTSNLYKPLRPGRDDHHYITVGRILGAVYICGAVAVALAAVASGTNIFRLWKIMAFIILACGPAMLMGFLWRRTNTVAVWASMGTMLMLSLGIPLAVALFWPQLRRSPALLLETRTPPVERTYRASERDVAQRAQEILAWQRLEEASTADREAPLPLRLGEPFTITTAATSRAVFWDEGLRQDDQGLYGAGYFKVELVLLHLLGIKLERLQPPQVEAISLLIRLLLPFVLVIGVGRLTAPMPTDHLDRFYAKMRLPVDEDRETDAAALAAAQADPASTLPHKLWPRSNWEFTRLARYDLWGMAIAAGVAVLLTVLVLVLARIGS